MTRSYELGFLMVDYEQGRVVFIPLLLLLLPVVWWCSVQIAGITTLGRLFGHISLACLTNLTFWLQYSLLSFVYRRGS